MTTVLHWYHISISIHALLAESDLAAPQGSGRSRDFYPRSPCGERLSWRIRPLCPGYFYPRSPCGERLFSGDHGHISGDISIHALLAESDLIFTARHMAVRVFLSTLSLRRATQYLHNRTPPLTISIHALLAESDFHLFASSGVDFSISIHALLAESDVLQS